MSPLGKDAFQLYLRDIGAIPLLTREEEISLAKRASKKDPEARATLIRANLRLVVKISKRYVHLGLPLLDLIEEGNIGLIKAIDRYDLNKGCKLSTYASWWIKQSIMRALANQGKIIRIPVYMIEKISHVKKRTDALRQKLKRMPSIEEIAQEVDLSEEKVAEMLSMIRSPSSLDKTLGEDGVRELIDVLEDKAVVPPSQVVATSMMKEEIRDLLALLSSRETEILSLRYGMRGKGPRTLVEIGRIFGITRERVRQIEESAIRKLRAVLEEQKREFQHY